MKTIENFSLAHPLVFLINAKLLSAYRANPAHTYLSSNVQTVLCLTLALSVKTVQHFTQTEATLTTALSNLSKESYGTQLVKSLHPLQTPFTQSHFNVSPFQRRYKLHKQRKRKLTLHKKLKRKLWLHEFRERK